MTERRPEKTSLLGRRVGVYVVAPAAACLAIYATIGTPWSDRDAGEGSNQSEITGQSPAPDSVPSLSDEPSTQSSSMVPLPDVTTSASASSPETTPEAGGLASCAEYQGREFELCTSYVVITAKVALQGMYKFGNNSLSIPSSAAKTEFESRFWGKPRQTIEEEVASWPVTSSILGNKVEDTILPVSVDLDAAADRGLIQTKESWRVTAPDGTILHEEPLHTKAATLCLGRPPGLPVREWLVVGDSLMPDFDCVGFNRENGIEP